MLYIYMKLVLQATPMALAVRGLLFVSEGRVRLLVDPYDIFGRHSGT